MKKIMFTILWTIGVYLVGLAIFAIFTLKFVHFSPNQDPNSPEVQHEAMRAGFVSLIFTILLPIVALILGICGLLPGTRRKKDLSKHEAVA